MINGRFCVQHDPRKGLYYVRDNEDGAIISARRLEYDKALDLANYLNTQDLKG